MTLTEVFEKKQALELKIHLFGLELAKETNMNLYVDGVVEHGKLQKELYELNQLYIKMYEAEVKRVFNEKKRA